MKKYIILFLAVILDLGIVSLKAFEQVNLTDKDLSFEMCRSLDHQFSQEAKACRYCAQGLDYNPHTLKCEGTPNFLGKCYGGDHYHAETEECMYCAHGYIFDEKQRACVKSF